MSIQHAHDTAQLAARSLITGQGIRVSAGANDNARPPTITSVSATTIQGALSGKANTEFRVEFFFNAACDPSGGGEGETFIGFATVATDSTGNAAINFATTVPPGQTVTATATDPRGGTSEFSRCFEANIRAAVFDSLSNQADIPHTGLSPSVYAAQTGPCGLLGYNIYISSTQPVQTVASNLWRSVPATTTASAPAAPAGSFYVVTTLWNCNGSIQESGASNQVGIPGGPTLESVIVSSKIKIRGRGFSAPAEVFIDGAGFVKGAKVGSKVVQKGSLKDGRSITEALVTGRPALISVRNANGGIGSISTTQR